ncbi:MAG: hypothetical protein KGL48_12515 [Sphingomonadales bacterium]|nr:hypothetical protein [Sphingomonadales bacterium]MDE2569567.1 hypothetical protein [Sphingomonadales bacterium]
MPQLTYVVHSCPVAGREDEYNDWDGNRHLADVAAVQGFVGAQRFRLVDGEAEGAPRHGYLAIYMMKTDEPAAAIAQLTGLVESGEMHISEAFSIEDMAVHLYEAITPVVKSLARDIS